MEEMSRCLSRRELLAALLLFTLFVLLTPSALGAHVAELTGRELAAASSNVVVAVVEDREVRSGRACWASPSCAARTAP